MNVTVTHPIAAAARPALNNQGLIREMLAMRFPDKYRSDRRPGTNGRLLVVGWRCAPPRQLR
jgi:hypothetical protein